MVWLKACPRCGGDLLEEHDWYTRTIKCFQCGRSLSPAQIRELEAKSITQKETPASKSDQSSDARKRKKHGRAA